MTEQPEGRDTRARIQAIALELFTEQGYDKTSLREIAERLGVTKAALYYHFKSKEEIVESFSNDHIDMIDRLMEWGRAQPPTLEARREFLRRYAEGIYNGPFAQVMQFYEQNQATMRDRPSGHRFKDKMGAIGPILCDPDSGPTERLRAAMSIFSLHASLFVMRDDSLTRDERLAAALTVAYDLIELNLKA
ncbi:AcrR family transcriptional regulator [Allocatelliglobosispora scoriae]|uniref:AcrR family transcriptional regulator n=1 Tax=Allocatelliglobosispora scoriae TaxID=643052 RepID=A0A841BYI5_9ACTN|nr:TetR/AcrR family transcriptional regulator [Allocatelliglobosispora scoriae]MBB5871780.1 AcrR family transcriptional regulator [Allocatelliglobosispora scoriae]